MVKAVYGLTRMFPKGEVFGLANQMQRAAVSIPSNIAEGHARQHTGEFRQFLFTALGSAAELDTQLTIAQELGYVTKEDSDKVEEQIREIRKMTYALISRLHR
jgi:four helix bundle protein